MRHAKSIGSLGLGLLAFAVSFLDVPDTAAWLLIALAVFLLIAAGLLYLGERPVPVAEPVSESASANGRFPDVEFETHGYGVHERKDDFHGHTIPRRVISLLNVRITNHEPSRRVSLTFDGTMPVTGSSLYSEVPVGRLTRMPIDLEPQASISLDIDFQRPMLEEGAHGHLMRIEVEEHLSGVRTRIPSLGKWRPARDGDWIGE